MDRANCHPSDRSDNGNEFLCLSCRNAEIRSGTGCQMEVNCAAFGMTGVSPVRFRVTNCNRFRRDDTFDRERAFEQYEMEAQYLIPSEEQQGKLVFISAAEAKRRGVII